MDDCRWRLGRALPYVLGGVLGSLLLPLHRYNLAARTPRRLDVWGEPQHLVDAREPFLSGHQKIVPALEKIGLPRNVVADLASAELHAIADAHSSVDEPGALPGELISLADRVENLTFVGGDTVDLASAASLLGVSVSSQEPGMGVPSHGQWQHQHAIIGLSSSPLISDSTEDLAALRQTEEEHHLPISEEKSEEEEEAEENAKELGLSFTLIAIIMILMILLFFVNSKDADIVAYTWDVLSKGINVFVSVMVFLAIEEPFAKFSPEGTSWWQVTIFMCLCLPLCLWLLLKVTTGQEDQTQKTVLIRTLGSLIAHLDAFTMINFWSNVQKDIAERQDGGPLAVGFVVVLAGLVNLVVTVILRFARSRYVAWDGVIDDDERLWLSMCHEVDLEAAALQLAFLAMQAIRFQIHGFMPDIWGELHGYAPTWGENGWLLSVAILACAMSLFLRRLMGKKGEEEEEEDDGVFPGFEHFVELFMEFFIFLCSWALLFAFQGIFEASDPNTRDAGYVPDVMLARTAVALMSSGWAFIIISCLDGINDRLYRTEMSIAKEALGIIAAVGMMVGFAWERCFHHAFEVAAGGVASLAWKFLRIEIENEEEEEKLWEVPLFISGCAVMSAVTVAAALLYITPKAQEATLRAKHEKSLNNVVSEDEPPQRVLYRKVQQEELSTGRETPSGRETPTRQCHIMLPGQDSPPTSPSGAKQSKGPWEWTEAYLGKGPRQG